MFCRRCVAAATPLFVVSLLLWNCTGVRAADPAAVEKPETESLPAIGSVAPEIEGVDIDNVPFKLSDYRGQVVVLDFWGDW
jgi:hypothetical protein